MVMRSVGFQLRTDGKGEVKNDFAEVKKAGVDAYDGIGDAAEQASARAEKAAADAADRQARAYAKIVAAAQQSGLNAPTQRTYTNPRAANDDLAAVKAAAALRAEIDPLWAAEQKLSREMERLAKIEKLGVLSSQELATAQALARKRFDETTDAIKRQSGAGGGLSRNQKQTLLYTASDIIGSSANGINPTQLLIQQGPQVLQAFAAEEGGLLKLRALINPVTVGIAGITAAVAVGAMAWLDHSNAVAKFNAVAQGSGRLIGLTGDALEANAASAAAAGNMTVSAAREIELAYVQTGKISGDVLVGLTALTKDFAAATGQDAKGAAAQLGAAFADPIAGASDLATRYGVINDVTANYIAKLVEQNDLTGAQRTLLDAVAAGFAGAADHANVLARSWDSIKIAAAGAWEWMGKALDRAATGGAINDQIKDLEAKRDAPSTSAYALHPKSFYQEQIDHLRFEAQQEGARSDRAKANAARASGQQIVDQYTGADQLDSYRTAAGKLRAALKTDMPPDDRAQLTNTLEAYSHAIDTFIPKQDKANQLAAIDAKISATKSPAAKAALAQERLRVEMSGQLATSADVEARAIANGTKARNQASNSGAGHAATLAREAASMEASARAALDVADAYLKGSAAGVVAEVRRKALTDATRKGIDVDGQVRRQLNLQISENVSNSAKAIAAMRDETAARAAVNDKVAAGVLPASQMNQALSDEAALRPLLTNAAVAQANGMTDAYDRIMKAVAAYRTALADAHAEEARSSATTAIDASRARVDEIKASILGMSGSPLEQSMAAARRAAEREADANKYTDGGPKGNQRTNFINGKIDEARAANAQSLASFTLDTRRGQEDALALSQRELELAGANDQVRSSELEKLRLALQIRRQFPNMAAADVEQILAGVDAQDAVNTKLKITAAALDEVRGYGNQFVDEVLSPDTWSSWGNAGKTILNSLKNEFIKLALLNPLKNLINGNKDVPTIGSAIGNIGKLFGKNATGTESWSGGLTWVNENGPELADLPNGTRIYPAAATRRMLSNANDNARGGGSNYYDLRGAVVTQDLIDQMNAIGDGAAMRGAYGGSQLAQKNSGKAASRQLS